MKKLQFKGVEAPPSIPEAEMTEVQRAAHKEAELADIFGGPSVAPPSNDGVTAQAYNPDADAPPVMPPADPPAAGAAPDYYAGHGGYGGGTGN